MSELKDLLIIFITKIGIVIKWSLTEKDAAVSTRLLEKIKKQPEKNDDLINGKIINLNDLNGDAPSVVAISSYEGSISSNLDKIVFTIIGYVNVRWIRIINKNFGIL